MKFYKIIKTYEKMSIMEALHSNIVWHSYTLDEKVTFIRDIKNHSEALFVSNKSGKCQIILKSDLEEAELSLNESRDFNDSFKSAEVQKHIDEKCLELTIMGC